MPIGNWVKCRTVPTAVDEYSIKDSLKNYAKAAKRFKNSEILKKYGWNNDADMLVERFIEATNKDPNVHFVSKGDVSVFVDYMKAWEKGIKRGFGDTAFTQWKVLEAKLQHLPHGRSTAAKIKHAVAHQRRHNQINEASLEEIRSATSKIAKEFGVDIGKLSKLEAEVMKAPDEATAKLAEKELRDFLGSYDTPSKRSAAGEVALGIADVMEGMDPANLKKANEKPWSGDAKREATNIRNAWISIRKDMLGVMLNGLRMEMATAKKIDAIEGGRRGLEAHLTRVRNKIIELEVIAKEGGEGTKYDLNMQEVGNLGLTESSTYQLEHRKGYMPHHILRIREHLTEFNDYMHSNTAETPEVAFREFVDFSNQTGTPDRAKSRRALTEPGYSRNPLFFIHKYIHDISRYNHSRAINDILVDTWGELRKSKDFAKGTAEQAEVDRSIDSALKLLNNLGEESFIGGSIGGKSNFGMKATRLLTSLGFIRAMAGSGRTAIRNYAGGRLMSVMEHGYYKNNSGKKYIEKNAELGSALTRELERYGLLWHRDSVELKDLIRDYTKGANMAAATRGSVEEGMLPPGMSEVRNAKGEVIGVTITNDAAFERTIRSVERVAGVGSILNQKIENTLRPQVFKAVFATAHKNIAELPDWYKAEQMGRSKENPPTMEEMNAWVIREAGKAAYDGVLASQFEYADVSKADVLSKHKVIGQFRHYMFELANWRQKTFREGWRAYKAAAKTGDVSMLSNYSAMKNYRMGLGIMLGNMLTMITGYGFYNILEAEDIQQAMNFMKIVTANPDTPEGRKSIEQASYGAGLASNLGITFSTVLELAKLMQWVNIDEEDKFFMASLTEGKPLSLPQDEWNFRMLRLANLQMARTRYQSGPDFMDGNTTRGLLVETGLYTDYEHRKAREGLLKQGNKLLGRKYRQRSKKNKPKTDEQIRQEALQVLSALGL